jgi:predicted Zn-dependent peptidase
MSEGGGSSGSRDRPTPGRAAPFSLPALHSFAVSNGLRATLVEAGTVPSVSLRLVLRAGAIDAGGATWLERLMAEYLREGAGDRDAAALARAVAALGGRLTITSGADTTSVSLTVLAEYADDAVALLAEVAARPLFPASEFERLISDQKRDLDVIRAEPSALASDVFQRALYGGHPYGPVLPDAMGLEGLDLAAVQALYGRNVGPRRAHVLAAGQIDVERIAQAIEAAFGGWTAEAPDEAPTVEPTSSRVIHAVDRPGAEQSTVMIGLPVISPGHSDYVALVLTNALLGGAFNSRVTRNIREDKGYTYSPRSAITAHRYASHWAQVADVTTDVTGASVGEIFGEIDRLRAEPPTIEELRGIQAYVAGSQTIRYATSGGIIAQLAFLDLHRLDTGYAERFVDRVYQIDPAEVQRIAVEYLRPEEMTIAVAGDLDATREQLARFGEIREAGAG